MPSRLATFNVWGFNDKRQKNNSILIGLTKIRTWLNILERNENTKEKII